MRYEKDDAQRAAVLERMRERLKGIEFAYPERAAYNEQTQRFLVINRQKKLGLWARDAEEALERLNDEARMTGTAYLCIFDLQEEENINVYSSVYFEYYDIKKVRMGE